MLPAIEIPVRNGYIQFAQLEELGAELSLAADGFDHAGRAEQRKQRPGRTLHTLDTDGPCEQLLVPCIQYIMPTTIRAIA